MAIPLSFDDLDRAADAHRRFGTTPGGPWDEFRGRFLALPAWFDESLDPLTRRYGEQQDKLWAAIAGVSSPYCVNEHEAVPEIAEADALYRPAFYQSSSAVAGDHLIALGHLVKLSDVQPGDDVLEYGPGFGQVGLAFARLGANVDAVDVNAAFCDAINAQAEFLHAPLRAHVGVFGDRPRPVDYKLIIFYECFHHAREFLKLIPRLRDLLRPDGKILMAGEPIADALDPGLPYPWGLRLDAESVAVVRWRGWYELGFQFDFLNACFERENMSVRRHPGLLSHYATAYEIRRRSAGRIFDEAATAEDLTTWHPPEESGCWTRACSTLSLGMEQSQPLAITAINHLPVVRSVAFRLGPTEKIEIFAPGERKRILLTQAGSRRLVIQCEPVRPLDFGVADDRSLGIFVEKIFCGD